MTPYVENITTKEKLRIATLNFLHDIEDVENRAVILADEINRIDPDVLCLQEVSFTPFPHSVLLDKLQELTSLKLDAIHHQDSYPDRDSGLATLSKLDKVSDTLIHFDGMLPSSANKKSEDVLAVRFSTPQGKEIEIINAHLSWGGHRENARLNQAVQINKYANSVSSSPNHMATYLAGDLNTQPSSMTSAYFRGEYVPSTETEGAYWIDSWAHLNPQDPGTTVNGHGYWSRRTALNRGILIPELQPARRIDYILAHGWSYGKPGTPLKAGQFADAPECAISDHKGVWVDVWDPES